MDIYESFGQVEPVGDHFLSELLPYDPSIKTGNRLEDGLKEYLLLLVATELAIHDLHSHKWENFDPLVGENACQIRAVRLALILSHCLLDLDSLLGRTLQAKVIIENVLSRLSTLNHKKTSLKTFLEQEFVNIRLTADEFFLVKSYILTRTKVSNPFDSNKPLVKNERTDEKKIKDISAVGSMFASNFISFLREKLSKSSVAFVRKLSKQLYSGSHIDKVLEDFSVTHRGLQCLPCYWATRVLLDHALQHRIPIVLSVQQKAKDLDYKEIQKVTLFFQATSEGYQVTERASLDPLAPALVLLGNSCRELALLPDKEQWIQELLEYGPVDLVLAYAAAHRQYPDESKDYLVTELNDQGYQDYKMKANEWGCSLENPARFFLSHAFCDKIENIKE